MSPFERALADYRAMLLIRRFEDQVTELRLASELVGSVHLCSGQEAIAVGACGALRPTDAVVATYRGHGWALARGAAPRELLAELLGRESGVNAGRGGSAMLSVPRVNFLGENSIVAAGTPIAAGVALAHAQRRTDGVALTVFGDGAMNQGAVHETMNLSAVRSLPVVFVCENNSYSELTPIDDMVRNPLLYERAAGYGIPGSRHDGNDVDTIREVVAGAAKRARQGDGPTFLEFTTQRIVGHYIGDAQTYRTQEEIAENAHREPIAALRRRLLNDGVRTAQDAVDRVDAEVQQEIDEATAWARAEPLSDAARLKEHIYA